MVVVRSVVFPESGPYLSTQTFTHDADIQDESHHCARDSTCRNPSQGTNRRRQLRNMNGGLILGTGHRYLEPNGQSNRPAYGPADQRAGNGHQHQLVLSRLYDVIVPCSRVMQSCLLKVLLPLGNQLLHVVEVGPERVVNRLMQNESDGPRDSSEICALSVLRSSVNSDDISRVACVPFTHLLKNMNMAYLDHGHHVALLQRRVTVQSPHRPHEHGCIYVAMNSLAG